MKITVLFGDGLDVQALGHGTFIREYEADVMTWMGAGKTPVGHEARTILYLNPDRVAAVFVERTTRDEKGE